MTSCTPITRAPAMPSGVLGNPQPHHGRYAAPRMSVRAIAAEVSAETGVPVAMIYGRSRRAEVVRARWAVWAKARAQGLSLPQIGRATGHDHTTVMHGLRRMESGRADMADRFGGTTA